MAIHAYDPDDAPSMAPQTSSTPSNSSSRTPSRSRNALIVPSPPPLPQSGPLLDHSHLRPGSQASLLSHERTLELYRKNAKKSQDPATQFEFAVFMIDASKSCHILAPTPANVIEVEKAIEKCDNMIHEAIALLKRPAGRVNPESQYFLADCFANGVDTYKGRQDFDRAYPLFVLAASTATPIPPTVLAPAARTAGAAGEKPPRHSSSSAKQAPHFIRVRVPPRTR